MATRLYNKELGIPEGVWALIPDDKFSAFLDAKNELEELIIQDPSWRRPCNILLQQIAMERCVYKYSS